MRRTFTTIICTAILAASMTLTASAADAEQTTITEEVLNEIAETAATEGVATDTHSDAALTEEEMRGGWRPSNPENLMQRRFDCDIPNFG